MQNYLILSGLLVFTVSHTNLATSSPLLTPIVLAIGSHFCINTLLRCIPLNSPLPLSVSTLLVYLLPHCKMYTLLKATLLLLCYFAVLPIYEDLPRHFAFLIISPSRCQKNRRVPFIFEMLKKESNKIPQHNYLFNVILK
jgi:hypothetical protein